MGARSQLQTGSSQLSSATENKEALGYNYNETGQLIRSGKKECLSLINASNMLTIAAYDK